MSETTDLKLCSPITNACKQGGRRNKKLSRSRKSGLTNSGNLVELL